MNASHTFSPTPFALAGAVALATGANRGLGRAPPRNGRSAGCRSPARGHDRTRFDRGRGRAGPRFVKAALDDDPAPFYAQIAAGIV